MSQNIEKHQWQQRVLLVFSKKKNSKLLENQTKILFKNKLGLKERKLIVYRFSNKLFSKNFDNNWKLSTINTIDYKNKNQDFFLILIGLDGGIKLRKEKPITIEKLFAVIDGMPMRKRELKNKKY